MPQWKAGSLFSLFAFFCFFLLIFNISASRVKGNDNFYPFVIEEGGYRTNISNASYYNSPISISPYPRVDEKANITIWCGLQAIKTNEIISFSSEYFLSKAVLCPKMMIEITPITNSTGLWIRSKHPLQNIIVLSLRVLFSLLFLLALFLFYQKGKAASTQRSTIIIIFSAIFMIDPLNSLLRLILPGFSLMITNIFTTFGMWKMASELFSEYAPLVRQSHNIFKFVTMIPPLFLFLVFYPSFRGLFSEETLTFVSILIGIILPFLAIWFLVMTGNTTGRFALIMQIASGVFILTSFFYIRFLKLTNSRFQSSFSADMIEISFISAYTIFQMIFKAGESVEEEAMGHLPHTPIRRFEKIDEILNSLVADNDAVKFDDEDDNDHISNEEPELNIEEKSISFGIEDNSN